jgi:hypothetical protein
MNDEPDEILEIVRKAGYRSEEFLPGESLDEFLERIGGPDNG